MLGNIMQWVLDWYADYSSGAAVDARPIQRQVSHAARQFLVPESSARARVGTAEDRTEQPLLRDRVPVSRNKLP